MSYLLLTTLVILFTYTKAVNPEAMLWGRFRIVMLTLAMWLVYRLVPCRFTHFWRIGVQLLLLPWWYPDTYELNRIFPNLDHLFATYEQALCGSQPALWFSQTVSHPVFSELMHLGYASYFPMIAVVTLFSFFFRYKEFDRTEFIILSAFFIFSSTTSSLSSCPSLVRNTTIRPWAWRISQQGCSLTWAITSPPTRRH